MNSIELTEEQHRQVAAGQDQPIEVVDPVTQRTYVLLARSQYELMRSQVVSGETQGAEVAQQLPEISPGILRSQQAFWRDLPMLLSKKSNLGKWVCYHGDERIGIAGDDEPLIRECIRRGLPGDTYYLDIIEPQTVPPWEEIEIEPGATKWIIRRSRPKLRPL